MNTDEWLAKHREHGDLTQMDEHVPGSVTTDHYLVCECGLRHLVAVSAALPGPHADRVINL